ncbi:MAG: hypothetical protein CMP49_02965 [Flavobacteriales bacterium]|nr:hypothetical protein [Flavobacteriales bacterium]|tara:strand:+ start:707 stop:1534 length:828 start_codon:yes stop_codon:yes gene_type:complete
MEIRKINYFQYIIYLNIAIFILVNLFSIIIPYLFNLEQNNQIINYLGLSADLDSLIKKPWVIFSHIFIHTDLFHLAINLCWLIFGGRIFIQYLNNNEFLSTYIMGGIFGAVVYIISYNIFPVFEIVKGSSLAIGSSASVLAILIAIATFVPNLSINIANLKLKHIAFLAVLVDLLSITNGNTGGHIAHLSGAIYGFFYIYLKKYNYNINWCTDYIIDLLTINKQKAFKFKRENDYDYNARKNKEINELNSVLEKISKSGYESLSKEEKEILFNQK